MSEGVDFYAFSSEGYSISVDFSGCGHDKYAERYYDREFSYEAGHHELERSGWPWQSNDRMHIRARHLGQEVHERSVYLNSYNETTTEFSHISLLDRANMLAGAVIRENFCFCFGFYYADPSLWNKAKSAISGFFDSSKLPNDYQLYAVVTQNQNKWMQRIFDEVRASHYGGLSLSDIKLKNLILPGSHDSGMYVRSSLPHVDFWANTQKDNTYKQLQLGARTFDFRPGCEIKLGIPSDFELPLAHVHMIITGESYVSFLSQIIEFLKKNQQEIVTVVLCTDGIKGPWDIFNYQKDKISAESRNNLLDRCFEKAREQVGYHELQQGFKDDLESSVETLIKANRRLIFLCDKNMNCTADRTGSRAKTWKPKLADSVDAGNALQALKEFNTKDGLDSVDLFDVGLQLTGSMGSTWTNVMNTASIFTQRDESPLVATKGMADHLTYNWLLEDNLVPDKLDKLITMTNDWYDCGLTEVAAKMLRDRFNKLAKRS